MWQRLLPSKGITTPGVVRSALQRYHHIKMTEINNIMKELWQKTYKVRLTVVRWRIVC